MSELSEDRSNICFKNTYQEFSTVLFFEVGLGRNKKVWHKTMDMCQHTVASFCNTTHSDDWNRTFKCTWHTFNMSTYGK